MGRELSDLLGRREFVIDTSRNGLGPPPDEPDRDDEWCNPRRQALGQAPTARTGMLGLTALLWSKLPGVDQVRIKEDETNLMRPDAGQTAAEWKHPCHYLWRGPM